MFEEFNEQSRLLLTERLEYWKDYITLADLHPHILWDAYKKQYTEQEITAGECNTPTAHELTLQYLLPLLKEGKLKVGIRKMIRLEKIPEGILRHTEEFREMQGEAEKMIKNIREYWNNPEKEGYELNDVEDTIYFTLPENPWPAWLTNDK